MSTGLIFAGIFVLALCCIAAIAGYIQYQNYQKLNWKGGTRSAMTAEQLALLAGQPVTPNVDCQNLSNTKFAWPPSHQGMAAIQDWAGFVYQNCRTYPSAITTNTDVMTAYYSNMGPKPPDKDPAMTDAQQIDSSGKYSLENPLAKKNITVSSLGAVKFGDTANGHNIWASPAGPPAGSGNYTMKFDSNTYNKGNLCVFPPNSNLPSWCIQPQISVPTTSCSITATTTPCPPPPTDVVEIALIIAGARPAPVPCAPPPGCPPGSYSGSDLASYQQSLLNSVGLKNTSDTQPRFAMIGDDGSFCVYRGTPGSPNGPPIICKSQ